MPKRGGASPTRMRPRTPADAQQLRPPQAPTQGDRFQARPDFGRHPSMYTQHNNRPGKCSRILGLVPL